MGMSTYVIGYRPPDEKWKRMKSAWNACKEAGVQPPDEVLEFFDHEDPGDKPGAQVSIRSAIKEYKGDCEEGYVLDIADLPDELRYIRFYNAW